MKGKGERNKPPLYKLKIFASSLILLQDDVGKGVLLALCCDKFKGFVEKCTNASEMFVRASPISA